MPIAVILPGPLSPLAGGRSRIVIEAAPADVGAALAALFRLHPAVQPRVVTEAGEVRPHVNVFVGSESIRYSGGLATPVPDGAEIVILPAVSGG
jgi:molybdopterin converting factor small subunit